MRWSPQACVKNTVYRVERYCLACKENIQGAAVSKEGHSDMERFNTNVLKKFQLLTELPIVNS